MTMEMEQHLIELHQTLVDYFNTQNELPMYGCLNFDFGREYKSFSVTLFSKWHREFIAHIRFTTWKTVEQHERLANNMIEAIEADDFERIIELSGYDRRTGVQKYIDKQEPYICPECGKKQHDPFNKITVETESSYTILGYCDECNTNLLNEISEMEMNEDAA